MTPTIPDEAVQAAIDALDADDTYVGEVDHCGQFIIDGPVNIKAMLTAALPFLQGVKADPWGWVIPRGGSKKPIILEASKFDQASAAAEADIHDFGYFPIYAQPVSAPSPRAQALEEAAKIAFDVSENGHYYGEASVDSTSSIYQQGAFEVYEALRALSSQPVADGVDSIEVTPSSGCVFADMGVERPVANGWLPIETAPKDGAQLLAYDKTNGYYNCWWHKNGYGEEYWMDEADTEPNPTHWRPLPASPGASSTLPTGGSNHGE